MKKLLNTIRKLFRKEKLNPIETFSRPLNLPEFHLSPEMIQQLHRVQQEFRLREEPARHCMFYELDRKLELHSDKFVRPGVYVTETDLVYMDNPNMDEWLQCARAGAHGNIIGISSRAFRGGESIL